MTFEQFCKKNRLHLWYERRTLESYHCTHRYIDGKLKLGRVKRVGEWICQIEPITLARSLMLKWINQPVIGSVACPVGTGDTILDAKADLISKIAGHELYIVNPDKVDRIPVPKGLK